MGTTNHLLFGILSCHHLRLSDTQSQPMGLSMGASCCYCCSIFWAREIRSANNKKATTQHMSNCAIFHAYIHNYNAYKAHTSSLEAVLTSGSESTHIHLLLTQLRKEGMWGEGRKWRYEGRGEEAATGSCNMGCQFFFEMTMNVLFIRTAYTIYHNQYTIHRYLVCSFGHKRFGLS